MKLAALAFLTTLGLGGAAYADPGRPDAPRPHGQLRQLMLERFDANHDGRLEPRERRHAIRALRRLARKMAMQDRGAGQRARGVAHRYDNNRDGDGGLDDRASQ